MTNAKKINVKANYCNKPISVVNGKTYYIRVVPYLKKAGNSPQALNARGVLAVRSGDKQAAERFWRQSTLPEAQHNLKELEKTF